MSSNSERIAFCGTRGLPAAYGGFETAVDEISRHCVANGIDCDVFCRNADDSPKPDMHEGRTLLYVKGSKSRTLDTFVSAFQTGWFLMKNRRRYTHVFWFNNANFPGILITWLARLPMSVNTDGLEWRRAKWSWPFKLYYVLSSFLISRICRRLISDSYAIQDYYRKHFWAKSTMIPYGTPCRLEINEVETVNILHRYELHRNRYFLQITRFEPDNLPLETLRAFRASRLVEQGYQMLLVGYKDATPYALRIREMDDPPSIMVAQAIYDPRILAILRANCFCYVHGNSVGGTNPALLEAMSGAPRIMAIDCEFSREVLGHLGLYFDPRNISPTFHAALQQPDRSDALAHRVASLYQWEAVAHAYLGLARGNKTEYRPTPLDSLSAVESGTV